MYRKRTLVERITTLLMVAVLVVGMIPLNALAVGMKSGQISMGLGELIAKNYTDLSEEEAALLNSGLLTSESFVLEPPASSEGLITVNSDLKEVEVKPYTKGGYTWTAEKVYLKYEGGEEIITLTDGKGNFVYAGDDYSIAVDYKLYISVALADQQKLLDAPAVLAQAMKNMDSLSDMRAFMKTIADNIGLLYKLATENLGTPDFPVYMDEPETQQAILDLYAECQANDGKFELMVMIDEYKAADMQIKHLLENGRDIYKATERTYKNLKAIHTSGATSGMFISFVIGMLARNPNFVPGVSADALDMVMDSLGENLETKMKPVVEDSWTLLDGGYVKAGLTNPENVKLDALVVAAKDKTGVHTANKEKLLANEVTLEANVNRHNVTVAVEFQYMVGETLKIETKTATTVLKGKGGLSVSEVTTLVNNSGLEADLVDSFNNVTENTYNIGTANYAVTVKPGFEGSLTGDITYTIIYTPKNVALSAAGIFAQTAVAYGTTLTMPAYTGTDGQSYIYTVTCGDVLTLGENEAFRVLAPTTITRELGVQRVFTLGDLIANSYKDMSASAQKILAQTNALDTGARLRFMLPVDTAGRADGMKAVKVDTCTSGISGLLWKPIYVEFYGTSNDLLETVNVVDGRAECSTVFSSAKVIYELELTDQVDAAEIKDISNLPHDLATEAKNQKSVMQQLMKAKSQMDQVNEYVSMLSMVNFETQAAKDAVADLLENVYDETNQRLYLYPYLDGYEKTGLAFYYAGNNREKMQEQVDKIAVDMAAIVADPKFVDALNVAGKSDMEQDIRDLVTELQSIQLPEVNEAIKRDADASYLESLAKAVEAAIGNTTSYNKAGELLYTASITVAAPNMAALNLTVSLYNSKGIEIGTLTEVFGTFATDEITGKYTLTDTDITNIEKKLAQMAAALEFNSDYYVRSGSYTLELVNGNGNTIEMRWNPKAYEVDISGSEKQTIYYDSPVFNLPGITTEGTKLEYTIDVGGAKTVVSIFTSAGEEYRLNAEQLANLASNDVVVTVEVIDRNEEQMKNTVDALNEALANGGLTDANGKLIASFILVQDGDGEYAIVLRINPQISGMSVNSGIAKIVDVFAGNAYIGMGGNPVYDRSTGKIYLQGVINMLLNSGMSLQTVANIIESNGNIVESLAGKAGSEKWQVIDANEAIEDPNTFGGLLIQSSMELGLTSKEDAKSYTLYITLEDFDRMAGTLKTADNALNRALNYVNVTFTNGAINVDATAPDRIYQAYMTLLLLMNYADIEDMASADYASLVENLADQFKEIVEATDGNGAHKLTAAVIQQTIEKVVENSPISDNVAKYIATGLRYLVNNADVENNKMVGSTYSASLNYDFAPVADNFLTNPEMKDMITGMIAEYTTGLNADFTFKLNNIDSTEYVAIVVDNSKFGIGKYAMVTEANLGNTLATAGSNAIVVMLEDATIPATTIQNAAIIDLNGKKLTVEGEGLTANGSVMIIDTTLVNAESGEIAGALQGSFTILAGHYTQDISAFLKKGYVLNGGVVENALFTVNANGEGYDMVVNADFMNTASIPNLRSLAIELAADLALKMYNNGSMAIGSYNIYSVEYEDVLRLLDGVSLKETGNELLDCIDCKGVTDFVNDFIARITDFNALANSVKNNVPVVSYGITTKDWDVKFHYSEDDSYITGSLVAGKENTSSLNVIIGGEEADKAALEKLLRELGKVVDSDISFNLENLEYRGGGLSANAILKAIDWSAEADVTVNLSQNRNYPALIGLLVAANGGSNADALVASVNDMLKTGNFIALRDLLENTPMNQIASALKAAKGKTFEQLTANMALDADLSEVKELEETYHDLLNVLYSVMNRLAINGGTAVLGAKKVEGSLGAYSYTLTRGDLTAKATLILFDEIIPVVVTDKDGNTLYTGDSLEDAFNAATVDGAVITAYTNVVLIGDVKVTHAITVVNCDKIDLNGKMIYLASPAASLTATNAWAASVQCGLPEYELKWEGDKAYLVVLAPWLGNPTATVDNITISGWKLDAVNKIIFLDVHYNGITEEKVRELITFETRNAVSCGYTYTPESISGGVIVNGAKMTVTASNVVGDYVQETYTIIILGDVNCNGRTESGDSMLMCSAYLGEATLNEIQTLAADMNQNGRLESGDAYKNQVKYLYWDENKYISALKNVAETTEE